VVEVAMLMALPIALACYQMQPCHLAAPPSHELVRSRSPAAIVSHAQPRENDGRLLRLALQRIEIPAAPVRSTTPRAQMALPRGARTGTTTGMLVLAGAVAGCYAGAHLAAGLDYSPDEEAAFIGMPIGAALGGWIVWRLVR
jgi:hypothetical protein